MEVLKFGGTSVGSPDRMLDVLNIVNNGDQDRIVVLSAMAGTTDVLKNIAHCLAQRQKKRAHRILTQLKNNYVKVVYDLFKSEVYVRKGLKVINTNFSNLQDTMEKSFSVQNERIISAFGELISTNLFYLLCQGHGIKCALFSALDIMKTDVNGRPDMTAIQQNIKALLKRHTKSTIYITQGYICSDYNDNINNLGRGGSDYTATLLGAAVNAREIQIWTDIDGLHNNDPRYVTNTQLISELSYQEAANLAFFGAKILHPTCVLPAQEKQIPIRIKNTFIPEAKGTLISAYCRQKVESAVSSKDKEVLVKIQSNNTLSLPVFYAKIFDLFSENSIDIDMVSIAHQSMSLVVSATHDLTAIIKKTKPFALVNCENDYAIINVLGTVQDVSEKILSCIVRAADKGTIRMISQKRDHYNYILLLVKSNQKIKVLKEVHESFNYTVATNKKGLGQAKSEYSARPMAQ